MGVVIADCTRNFRRAHSQLKVLTSAKPIRCATWKSTRPSLITLLIHIQIFLARQVSNHLGACQVLSQDVMAPYLQNPLKENYRKGATHNTQVAWLVSTFVLCLVCGSLFVVFFKRPSLLEISRQFLRSLTHACAHKRSHNQTAMAR